MSLHWHSLQYKAAEALVVRLILSLIFLFSLSSFAINGGEFVANHPKEEIRELWRYVVDVEIRRSGGPRILISHNCTGTIVGKQTIILAGHCLNGEMNINFRKPTGEIVKTILSLTGIRVAKSFDEDILLEIEDGKPKVSNWTSEQVGDLGIIQLEENIPEGYLPMKIDYFSEPNQLGSKNLYKVGYGRFSETPDISFKISQSKIQLAKDGFRFYVPGPTDGKTCQGDSGGSEIYFYQGKPILVGVISGAEVIPKSAQSKCDGSPQVEFVTAIRNQSGIIYKVLSTYEAQPVPYPTLIPSER